MDIQKQQQLLNNFIEDTNERLDIIQRAFVNLSNREEELEDRESLNEIFRATHSIKGCSQMVGIKSIRDVAYKLEDFARAFQKNTIEVPMQVDYYLETRFIKVCQSLKEILYSLAVPIDFNTDKAEPMVAKIGSVLQEIECYLGILIL